MVNAVGSITVNQLSVGVFYSKFVVKVDKLNSHLLEPVHPQWRPIVTECLAKMDQDYLNALGDNNDWLPGANALLNAFSHPFEQTDTLLLGESPYPRAQSANGYAFWDADVGSIWSEKGLSKQVNRATSLRNLIKMLLVARGDLKAELTTQNAIALVDKSELVETLAQLFGNLVDSGFLLLNASLVLSSNKVTYDAKHWQVFMDELLEQLIRKKPEMKLILFGKIANKVNYQSSFSCLIAEHPYNVSFISNENVLNFFKPLDLLRKR